MDRKSLVMLCYHKKEKVLSIWTGLQIDGLACPTINPTILHLRKNPESLGSAPKEMASHSLAFHCSASFSLRIPAWCHPATWKKTCFLLEKAESWSQGPHSSPQMFWLSVNNLMWILEARAYCNQTFLSHFMELLLLKRVWRHLEIILLRPDRWSGNLMKHSLGKGCLNIANA